MSDDSISRQAAIEALNRRKDKSAKGDIGSFYNKIIENDIDAINALPSAEPIRMKGKWIFHETENDRYDDMICPFCKTCYTVDAYRIDDIGLTAEDFNFCLNCGADMRGEEDDNSNLVNSNL